MPLRAVNLAGRWVGTLASFPGHTDGQCPPRLQLPGLGGGRSFFQWAGSAPVGPLTTGEPSPSEGAVCELP